MDRLTIESLEQAAQKGTWDIGSLVLEVDKLTPEAGETATITWKITSLTGRDEGGILRIVSPRINERIAVAS